MLRRHGKSRSSREGITPCSMIHSLRSPRSSSSLTTSDTWCLRPEDSSCKNVPTSEGIFHEVGLFPDAKAAEDQVENVVSGGGAGDLVERAQRVVEVEQEHLMRHLLVNCGLGGFERGNRIADQPLVAQVGEKSSFGLGACLSAYVAENLLAQLGNPFAGYGRCANLRQLPTSH